MTRDRHQPWVTTPLIESSYLSKNAGCRIFLKLDNLQPSGSFKSRGVGNYVLRRVEESRQTGATPHFYASSGGNAGIACVVAASAMGYEATVVIPTTTSAGVVARLHAEGVSRVVQHGADVMTADKFLRGVLLPADPAGVYVPPFDHPDVWEGNASIMDEIAAQMDGERPDLVVCSVGGGGLMNGIVMGLDRLAWGGGVTVLAMETRGADSLHHALRAKRLVGLDEVTSEARSLAVKTVSAKTFEYAQRPQVVSAVLSDGEAAKGCLMLARHERIMVELTAGVAIVLCQDDLLRRLSGRQLDRESKVVLVVCGGNDISVELLMRWKERYGLA